MTSDWIRLMLLIPDSVSSRILAAENETIPALLTGGGFAFLAAVMGGLFLINKNASDGAAALARGSTELTEGVRQEIKEVKADRDEVKKQCSRCEARLNTVLRQLAKRDSVTNDLLEVLDKVVAPVLPEEQADAMHASVRALHTVLDREGFNGEV